MKTGRFHQHQNQKVQDLSIEEDFDAGLLEARIQSVGLKRRRSLTQQDCAAFQRDSPCGMTTSTDIKVQPSYKSHQITALDNERSQGEKHPLPLAEHPFRRGTHHPSLSVRHESHAPVVTQTPRPAVPVHLQNPRSLSRACSHLAVES